MLFLLSCLMSYETDSDQTTFGIEQTMAVHHVNFDYGRKSSVKSLRIVALSDEAVGKATVIQRRARARNSKL